MAFPTLLRLVAALVLLWGAFTVNAPSFREAANLVVVVAGLTGALDTLSRRFDPVGFAWLGVALVCNPIQPVTLPVHLDAVLALILLLPPARPPRPLCV